MAILMLLLGMVSTIVIVVFALQNGRIVTVSFFDWSIDASLVLVIIVSALMGFLTALFFELFIQIKLRYRLYKSGRQIRQLEEEVASLRRLQSPNRLATQEPQMKSTLEEKKEDVAENQEKAKIEY